MADRRAHLVLFDLGGVLIELGGVQAMGEMAGISPMTPSRTDR